MGAVENITTYLTPKETAFATAYLVQRLIDLSAINGNSPHHIKPCGYQIYYVTSLPALLRQHHFLGALFYPYQPPEQDKADPICCGLPF